MRKVGNPFPVRSWISGSEILNPSQAIVASTSYKRENLWCQRCCRRLQELPHMKLWTSGLKTILLVFGLVSLMPQPGNAIPAFARKYGVKCYTCHTVPPALNKNGYM